MELKAPLKNHFSASPSTSSIVASFVWCVFLPLGWKETKRGSETASEANQTSDHMKTLGEKKQTAWMLFFTCFLQTLISSPPFFISCSWNSFQQHTECRTSVRPGFFVEWHLIVESDKSRLLQRKKKSEMFVLLGWLVGVEEPPHSTRWTWVGSGCSRRQFKWTWGSGDQGDGQLH